jgi:hypothetical protein
MPDGREPGSRIGNLEKKNKPLNVTTSGTKPKLTLYIFLTFKLNLFSLPTCPFYFIHGRK